ncbi:hypothetical protein FHS13_001089 [Nocardiopsis algeriensis]|uniref:Uncharacterized protein n=1 Tax=Nocardiopsis algeriensis TaxID=1478215 RepID=A0A841IM85_9ACTN|nr:hypothetical protein [Nocardiopsis algeriensis]
MPLCQNPTSADQIFGLPENGFWTSMQGRLRWLFL